MMRRFSSYGSVDTKTNYYAPRIELIDNACTQLLGEDPDNGGHYITIWAPRQTGKTWIMNQVLWRFQKPPVSERFDVVKLNLQNLTNAEKLHSIQVIARELARELDIDVPSIHLPDDFEAIFTNKILVRPLVLMIDEFDALSQETIHTIVSAFRNIHLRRRQQADRPTDQRDYLLHSVGLIGVRAVLGIGNDSGSPFNVQRSLHIPNLTFDEVNYMFHWYEKESRQTVGQIVIDRLFYEMRGQPGLVSWLGELLTETYNDTPDQPITSKNFDRVFLWATQGLPSNNIQHIISKVRQKPHRETILSLFDTKNPLEFSFDDASHNFLYLNGAIDVEEDQDEDRLLARFANSLVQKRLFNYFARELFPQIGVLYDPFDDLRDTITDTSLNIKALIKRYETYFHKNREWILRDAPQHKKDLRIHEAVYHFNLFLYLVSFLRSYVASVVPEFPTGNGKLDIFIRHAGRIYGLEVKSFANQREYRKALLQAARYGQEMEQQEMWLILFIERVDDANRRKFETIYTDQETDVIVHPLFVSTEN